jgi:hypothetical protein
MIRVNNNWGKQKLAEELDRNGGSGQSLCFAAQSQEVENRGLGSSESVRNKPRSSEQARSQEPVSQLGIVHNDNYCSKCGLLVFGRHVSLVFIRGVRWLGISRS